MPACQFDPETGQLRPEWRRMMQRFGLNPSDPALLQWLSAPQPGPDPRSPAELLAGSPGDFEAAAQAAWGQTWAAAA
ncbi:MAG: hypothetical protein EKK53_00090 [Burkholderiales bacterium]|nr:MAG: hypothetical protein EKK53_00090 [Burkholderiales bacterium]